MTNDQSKQCHSHVQPITHLTIVRCSKIQINLRRDLIKSWERMHHNLEIIILNLLIGYHVFFGSTHKLAVNNVRSSDALVRFQICETLPLDSRNVENLQFTHTEYKNTSVDSMTLSMSSVSCTRSPAFVAMASTSFGSIRLSGLTQLILTS
jgi:hypothetical protein